MSGDVLTRARDRANRLDKLNAKHRAKLQFVVTNAHNVADGLDRRYRAFTAMEKLLGKPASTIGVEAQEHRTANSVLLRRMYWRRYALGLGIANVRSSGSR